MIAQPPKLHVPWFFEVIAIKAKIGGQDYVWERMPVRLNITQIAAMYELNEHFTVISMTNGDYYIVHAKMDSFADYIPLVTVLPG